jgi:SNF2 family DNA or RNA helicase
MRYQHQQSTIDFLHKHEGKAFIASDAGTGKTPTVLWWFSEAKVKGTAKRMLVLCPKSIVEPAWLADARKFVPHLRVTAAGKGSSARKNEQASDPYIDMFITNHDAISHMDPKVLLSFDTICIDESTVFKGNSSARTKQLHNYVKKGAWKNRIAMSGTPMPQSILDLWGQLYFVRPDLVPIFTQWRFDTTIPRLMRISKQTITTYEERPGVRDTIVAAYSSTIIRYAKDDCLDLPPQTMRTLTIELSPALRKHYDEMAKHALLELETGAVAAQHAGVLAQKLLQVASGFAYGSTDDNEPVSIPLSDERYDLIGELVEERAHSLVAFSFKAQREYLIKELNARKIKFAVLDGDTKDKTPIVEAYQRGEYQTLLCNPQSVAHGLTLTRGDTIIWAGATSNLEFFVQFNARIDRVSQTKHNEVIMIEANHTYEQKLYAKLLGKHASQLDLLDLLKEEYNAA